MEGYVAKRADAVYLPGRRTSSWVKVKCVRGRELVVGGWSAGQGGRSGSIGSLAVGCWGLDPATGAGTGAFHFVGLVGSGLSEDLIRQLAAVFQRTRRDTSPFAEQLVGGALHYVEPLLVAEVGYTEITEAGTLRHPTLQGFRNDVNPDEVVADEALQEVIGRRPTKVRLRPMG
jgi:bifunctional non-homologous end joining protein LigD